MYSKHEASQLRQEFWTTFGLYMSPVLSSEGEKINWINYKTGEKDIFFRMTANQNKVYIAIELTHKDEGMQALYFEQFQQLQSLLCNALGEEWTWLLDTRDESGKSVSRIYIELENVSIFKKEDWPLLISFLKPRIIAVDKWWSTAKYVFETMR